MNFVSGNSYTTRHTDIYGYELVAGRIETGRQLHNFDVWSKLCENRKNSVNLLSRDNSMCKRFLILISALALFWQANPSSSQSSVISVCKCSVTERWGSFSREPGNKEFTPSVGAADSITTHFFVMPTNVFAPCEELKADNPLISLFMRTHPRVKPEVRLTDRAGAERFEFLGRTGTSAVALECGGYDGMYNTAATDYFVGNNKAEIDILKLSVITLSDTNDALTIRINELESRLSAIEKLSVSDGD